MGKNRSTIQKINSIAKRVGKKKKPKRIDAYGLQDSQLGKITFTLQDYESDWLGKW